MKAKAIILIVEDEAILYDRLRTSLEKEHFKVLEYCPSYEEACFQLKKQTPDIILLDIDLQGEKTGLDLGRLLKSDYNIPFIYVTGYDDDKTFYEGLHTQHSDFIVKTKPNLDIKEIIRAIHTNLHNKKILPELSQYGTLGLSDYLENIKHMSHNEITKIPVNYEDIAFFSNRDLNGNILKSNYICFQSISTQKQLFLRCSLKEISDCLPYYFSRINESYIVNFKVNSFQGLVNGKRISVFNQTFEISGTYKKEVENLLTRLYNMY